MSTMTDETLVMQGLASLWARHGGASPGPEALALLERIEAGYDNDEDAVAWLRERHAETLKEEAIG